MGNWAWGMGHWAWGMGPWALGMGHWALGIGHWNQQIITNIAILNDLLIVREQDARTVRILPWIDFATDLGLLYKKNNN